MTTTTRRERYLASHAVCRPAIGLLGLLLGLVGCGGPSIIQEVLPAERPLRLVIAPLVNRTGADIERLPATLWRSADLARMLVQLEETRAPLPAWPFDTQGVLPLPEDDGLHASARYDGTAGELIWTEEMTHDDRRRLLQLSDDARWQAAIENIWQQLGQHTIDAGALLREAAALRFPDEEGIEPVHASPRVSTTPVVTDVMLRELAAAHDASLVLLLTWREYRLGDAFTTGEITFDLTAGLFEIQADGAIRTAWLRSTGPTVLAVPEATRTGIIRMKDRLPEALAELIAIVLPRYPRP